jgi:hypothetical protein
LKRFNEFLDQLSNFLAHRKGLLPVIGILLVVINFILQLIPGLGWLATSNLFLHLGVILSILGMMLAWAL